jgi:hypothetical protein
MSTLVVYFSRSGTTRRVAETLAGALEADLEGIRELRSRRGWLGYLRSARDARQRRWVPIEALERDPSRYDLVILGTPVWYWSLSAPVRSFLASQSRRLAKVAFFVTEGGSGERRVFRQMAEVAGTQPVATLAVTQRDVESGQASRAIDHFVASLPKRAMPSATQLSIS